MSNSLVSVLGAGILIVLSSCQSANKSHAAIKGATRLEITNMSVVAPAPMGLIVDMPEGWKTAPLFPPQDAVNKDSNTLVKLVSGAGEIEWTMMLVENESDKFPKSEMKEKIGDWGGSSRLDNNYVDPLESKNSLAKTSKMYMLQRENLMLIVYGIWPTGNKAVERSVLDGLTAFIHTVRPNENAKKVDYFPGAGKESNAPVPKGTEIAMLDGMTIEATTPVGKMKIHAGPGLKRDYTWEGATRSVIMIPRGERWYGSKGMYYPGPGDHWEEHNGISRGVVEEGQQNFKTVLDAQKWIEGREYMKYVWNHSGLVVGWDKVMPRRQLNVEVWQITIKGKKPKSFGGSHDDKLLVTSAKS